MRATYESLLDGGTPPGIYSWAGDPGRDLIGLAIDADWETLALDTSAVRDSEAFYEELSSAWGLPPWFDTSLDGLSDMLAEITAVPTLLIWDDLGPLDARRPDFVAKVIEVLRDCVERAPRFAVILRGDTGISAFDALL